MKKILSLVLVSLFLSTATSFAAWDKTKPGNSEKLKDAPAQIRDNWQAIETGTDTALQITNAKVHASAAIVDTKLAQITTAGKVSGAALTTLGSIPSGAGLVPVVNGGTNKNLTVAAGGVVWTDADSIEVGAAGSSGQILRSAGTSAPVWSTATYPATAGTSGNVLTSDGTNWTSAAAAAGGTLLAINFYTSSDTWSKPSGATKAWVRVVGGGGGGAGSTGTSTGSSGGGGGGYSEEWITSGLGSSETVTIGAGGAGGSAGSPGSNGGTSSFGSFLSATGGSGGTSTLIGGEGGSGADGSINIGGGAGGSAGGTTGINIGGAGGSSVLGGGGVVTQDGVGGTGKNYGGGGGGVKDNSGTNFSGGAGAGGLVIVYSYS